MTVSRRSFLSGLLATALAPALPPIPKPRGTEYIVYEDIPLERLGNRVPQVVAYWQPFISSREIEQIRAIWHDRTRVYSPAELAR